MPVVQVLALAAHKMDAFKDVDDVVNASALDAQFPSGAVQADLSEVVIAVEVQKATASRMVSV